MIDGTREILNFASAPRLVARRCDHRTNSRASLVSLQRPEAASEPAILPGKVALPRDAATRRMESHSPALLCRRRRYGPPLDAQSASATPDDIQPA